LNKLTIICKFVQQHGINIRTLHHYIANVHKKEHLADVHNIKFMNTSNVQFGISVNVKLK